MSSYTKLLIHQQERLDIPDLLALQDYIEDDFQNLNIGLMTGANNYIVYGFIPEDAGGLSITMDVEDSKLMAGGLSTTLAGSLYVGPSGASALTATLTNNTTNYIHLRIARSQENPQVRVFWDPTASGVSQTVEIDGTPATFSRRGAEFTQIVNTQNTLGVSLYITTGAFSASVNDIPIAEIVTSAGGIATIKDRRNMLFRLGVGYPYSPYYLNLIGTTAENEEVFDNVDKSLGTMKEWMNAVMSEIKDMKFGDATGAWFEPAPSSLLSGQDLLSEGGEWQWGYPEDISDYTVAQTATVTDIDDVGPATWGGPLNFSNDQVGIGAGNGYFEVAVDPALAPYNMTVGSIIKIDDSDSAEMDELIVLSITDMGGGFGPWCH